MFSPLPSMISPLMAFRSRAMVFTTVDLPWPLAPRMPMRCPASTERLTLRTMVIGSPPAAGGG
ncbi:hypothetical protein Y695_04106 [Hydrogenophaga sp. T4]|nr:hypothetical protein Y695_04106 [Hydrogenophaga sp. T4]